MRQTKKAPEKQEDEVDLQVAVMVGDKKGVEKYIDQGGDLDVRDEDGATAIFHAACWNHVDIMKTLVSAGANLYIQRNDGFTALHVAAKNNQPKITEVLVEAMDDLGVQEEFGDTALHCAYRSKATEVIETLLAAGADSETLNHMGDTPRKCEGTGVDRQEELEDYDDDDDENDERQATAASVSASNEGNAGGRGKRGSRSSARRPSGGRSTAASTSPRTTRTRSGHGDGDDHGRRGSMAGSDVSHASFRVAYPPTIRGGGEWQAMTAYLFEPSAHQAVRHAHRACINGDQRHTFVPSDEFDAVEERNKTIPSGTQVVVRPRFPKACRVSPVSATVEWTKDAHAVPFEVLPPADVAGGGLVTGCVDFFVGPVLIGQAPVEMAVGKQNDGRNASERNAILGPVTRAFDKLYVCFAPADEPLLVPSLERFKRLGVTNVTWRPACEDKSEQDNKKLIRECSAFQICWSISAKRNDRVREEIRYAASLVKTERMTVRGVCWDPSLDATSIQLGQGLVFPIRLHDSFLLEDPQLLPLLRERAAGAVSFSPDTELGAAGEGHDGAMEPAPEVEKLCTTAVEHTRGHVSRLRGMVDGADVVDIPRIVWIHPDDSGGKPGSIDIKTDEWLKKTIRVNFLCPISMKPGRCGDDGKGYKMSFPRGWSSKIGSALKIGVVVVAAASDVGEIIDLPAPSTAAVAAWAEEGAGERSSAEKQGDLVNAAFDALADAVPDKLNDMVDSAFMDAETEGDSAPPASAQLRKETKQSYANLRSLLQKYDKGLKKTGLMKVTHEGAGGASTTEWVHPSVAELFRRKGPAIFDRKALAGADAEAAQEAAARHKATMMQKRNGSAGGGRGGTRSSYQGLGHDKLDVMSTLRTLENQVLALVEGADHVPGAGGA